MEKDIIEFIQGNLDLAKDENWTLQQWIDTLNEPLEQSYKKSDYHPNIIVQILCQHVPELNKARFRFNPSLKTQTQQLKYLLEHPVKIEQRTPEWYAYRHNHINASEAGSILNKKSYGSILFQKCQPFIQSSSQGVASEHGTRFEQVALEIHRAKNSGKIIYDFGSIEHPKIPFLAASPDGIDEDGVMKEIKNPLSRQIIGAPKPDYYVQVQLQMEVCNLEKADFIECKITEYECPEYYYEDSNKDFKGLILEYHGEEGTRRFYSSFNINEDQIKSWKKEISEGLPVDSYLEEIYWKLEVYSEIRIYRDRIWFAEVLPKLQTFWNEVIQYREKGTAPIMKQRIAKPVLERKPSACLIDDNDDNY